MLDQLLTLADDNSSIKRFELMNAIADMFVADNKRKTSNELELFSDIFITLLGKMDDKSKAEISHRFAHIPSTPKSFAVALASESAEIAAPMLEHSQVFADDDLVDITNVTSTEHRIIIARRADVSIPITDALIDHCETLVFRAVVENESSRISISGFNQMLEHSPEDGALLALLLKRSDLPDEIKTLLPHLPGGLFAKMERVANSYSKAELQDLMDRAHELHEQDLKENAKLDQSSIQEVNDINRDIMTLDEAVTFFAKAGQPKSISYVISEIEQIEQMHLDYAMLLYNGDPITMLCRSINLSTDAFLEICYMRETILDLPPNARNKMIKSFNKLDVETAQRTMRHMKLKSNIQNEKQYM